MGAHAIFADAIDGKAATFYAAFGFTALTNRPNTLYLPVATARQAEHDVSVSDRNQ